MSETLLMHEASTGADRSARSIRVVLDSRRPQLLDHRDHVLQVVSGHVDLFAVGVDAGRVESARHHLFRVECGEIIPHFPEPDGPAHRRVRVIAVGGPGAEAVLVARQDLESAAPIERWISRLSTVIAGPNPSWEIREAAIDDTAELDAGERRRGPARDIIGVAVKPGMGGLRGREPAYTAG